MAAAQVDGDVGEYLLWGLSRLDYRGYDSAGVALMSRDLGICRLRSVGQVGNLKSLFDKSDCRGSVGIGHTRWATHGAVNEQNAHPIMSGSRIALVHNGVIENFQELGRSLKKKGYVFESQTDTEAVAHLIASELESQGDFFQALVSAIGSLKGDFALAVLDAQNPSTFYAVMKGCPLILGTGESGAYLASDLRALSGKADKVVYLQDGDVLAINASGIEHIVNVGSPGVQALRTAEPFVQGEEEIELGNYESFMQKEIWEQPQVVEALAARVEEDFEFTRFVEPGGRNHGDDLDDDEDDEDEDDVKRGVEDFMRRIFESHDEFENLKNALLSSLGESDYAGKSFEEVLDGVAYCRILACGTSYYAGLVAKYWIEEIANLRVDVEIASEFSNRSLVAELDTLDILISQSGETFDTKQAAKQVIDLDEGPILLISNTPRSSIARDSDFLLHTDAGVEVGVASTKAFTTQLVALFMLTVGLGIHTDVVDEDQEEYYAEQLGKLGDDLRAALSLDSKIAAWAEELKDKESVLFIGRGAHYPIAMEGALKLKEISYIHAEGYPGGELKHGPLALIEDGRPVIVLAPNNHLFDKMKTNMGEITSRGGKIYVFTDEGAELKESENVKVIRVPVEPGPLSPVVYAVLVQLLAYHTAILRGKDVDKPRNLAKAVTVE